MTVGACKRQKIKAIMSNDEQTKCVSPSSRRHETCHLRATVAMISCPRWARACRNLRLDGVGFNFHRFSSEASLDKAVALSCTTRTTATAGACGSPSRVRGLSQKPKQRERQPMATTPPEGTSSSSRNVSTMASSVLLPPHPHTLKLLWNCCERAHGPSVAFPSNVKWHSPPRSKSLQLRAQYTLGWLTCSRSCGPLAVVTSTLNSRQVALRTTLGLLMQ